MYNGWSNRDTWAMALNIDNDYRTYHAKEETARACFKLYADDPKRARSVIAMRLASFAREWVRMGLLPDFDPKSPEHDDFDGVNWDEIVSKLDASEYAE